MKLKRNSAYKNYSVSIITDDVINTYDVLDIVGNDVEYVDGFLPISDSRVYVDQANGGLHYIFNLDLPAKVEATKLKFLRRSMAIHNIFSYDVSSGVDMFKFLPWVAIILLILFK